MRTLRRALVTAVWLVGIPVVFYVAAACIAVPAPEDGGPDGPGALRTALALIALFGGLAALLVASNAIGRSRRLADPPPERRPPGY